MNILIRNSALKHNLTEDEIDYAFLNIFRSKRVYSKKYDYENIWAIGILPNGNSCELIFSYKDIDTAIIFHAMSPARKSFTKKLERKDYGIQK